MTGTAQTEAAELHQIYKLGVVPIPTNRPMVRADQADLIYKTEEAKFDAVADGHRRAARRRASRCWSAPRAWRSRSTCRSCCVAAAGAARGAQRQAARRARRAIIAQAGRTGAVTVATNMAGRGTDIMLGGNPEFLADLRAAQPRARPGGDAARSTRRPGTSVVEEMTAQVAAEAEEVRDGRRAVRARHRAARVAAHRQPAARPLRPPGRPRRVAVLPLARRRADAPVQRPAWSSRS